MSTADAWYFTVPDDDAELLAELRRHGVVPGRRLHVSLAPEEQTPKAGFKGGPRRLSFAGSVHEETDLSEKTDDYLRGLGQA
jgi:hypothetical protein